MRSVLFIILAVFETASAGFEHRGAGGRSRALGGTYTALANDVWAVMYNVGGLSRLTMSEVSFYYSPQPFGLGELSYGAASIALPTSAGVIGISGSKYGFDLYKEFSIGVSYAHRIEDIGVGINIIYYSLSIQNYGSAGTMGIDVGLHVHILSQLSSGLAVKNINSPTIGTRKEKLSQTFSVGLAYTPMQSTTILLDYQKETGYDASPRLGFEYWLIESVALRGGISDEPSQSSGGVGFRVSMVQLDYAFSHHQELGWSHQASITLRW